MISLTRTFNRLLRQQGIFIRRSRYPRPRKSQVRSEERRYLAGRIDEFLAQNPHKTGPTCRRSLEDYLHFSRLAFYHDVMSLCRDAGVEFNDRDVADVGTGVGYLCRIIKLQSPSARVRGFDLSAPRLEFARFLCPDVEFRTCDLMDVDGTYDVVFLMEVLEHMNEPETVLQKLLSLVRPQGWAVITVPNGREDHYLLHVNFWSPESWRHFIEINVGKEFRPTFGSTRNGNNFVAIRSEAESGDAMSRV
jgi:2-polyprenyl-3-methyl-5-hydroxy-6-metoxy-1,4-benzoquinol methylase